MLKQRRQFIRKKERKSFFLKILFYLILTAFLGTTFYILFFSPMLQILSVKISGNKNIDHQLILNEINSEMSGKYLWCVKKDNLLLINVKKIERNILEKFKGIKNAEIKRKFPNRLEINISERIPTIIFCSREKCLILDENGQAYDEFESFLSENKKDNFLKILDESGKEINIGDTVLELDYINYVQNIREKIIQNFNFKLENGFRTPSIISNNIRVKTKAGWEIYFNRGINLEREIEMLRTFLKNGLKSEQQENNLEYIDLRIDGKIFFKFRGDSPEGLIKKAEIEAEKINNKNH